MNIQIFQDLTVMTNLLLYTGFFLRFGQTRDAASAKIHSGLVVEMIRRRTLSKMNCFFSFSDFEVFEQSTRLQRISQN